MGRRIVVWDVRRQKTMSTLLHDQAVFDAAFAADAGLVLTASGKAVWIWDVARGRCLASLEHPRYVHVLAVTADGRVALSGSNDGSARLWDLTTRTCIQTFVGHADTASAVALTDDALFALTAGHDGDLRVWALDWDYDFGSAR